MDSSLIASSVHEISQARILEWVEEAISFFRESSGPRDQTLISRLAGGFFTIESPGKPMQIGSFKKRKKEKTDHWRVGSVFCVIFSERNVTNPTGLMKGPSRAVITCVLSLYHPHT